MNLMVMHAINNLMLANYMYICLLLQLNESKPPTIIDVLTQQEESPAYYPSFEDRVGIDIVAVTCTVIEMCCWRQLRAAMPANPSLLQRVSTIRRLLKNGQLQIKR